MIATKLSVEQETRQRRVIFLLAARLLSYPDQDLLNEVELLGKASHEVADEFGRPIRAELARMTSEKLLSLQQEYVSTFDLKRRCCLFLTYYLNGDTRRRGMALWRFKETYRLAGMSVTHGELPDFLPVLLEFAAEGGDSEQAAISLLDEHRQGLEVLHAALAGLKSSYAPIVAVVIEALPQLTTAQRDAAALLVAQGPPTESVGLEPFTLTDITVGARS